MSWLLGGIVLLVVGLAVRRILNVGRRADTHPAGLTRLDPKREAIYQSMALEVETQAAILGISLNDAFEERDAGRGEIAWRMVQLSFGEWNRLADLVTSLLKTVAEYLPSAGVLVPVRNMVAQRFRSEPMIDYVRMHELLDQLVFSSRLRFQLHLRVLRKACENLTAEFRRAYGDIRNARTGTDKVWRRLDLCFHDLDLVSKEALLTLRTLLNCLPDWVLEALSTEVKGAVENGVRSNSVAVER